MPGPPPGTRQTVAIDGSELALRWIPAGRDLVGRPGFEPCWTDDDVEPWTVHITRGFWIGETEITRAQWTAVMHREAGHFSECGPDCPIESVTWHDVQTFVAALNALAGGGFRLPTEAEWEYAVRAGSDGPFSPTCSDYSPETCAGRVPCLDGIAWYLANAAGTPHPVGRARPNAWGLFDVHGNVAEWCGDWYGRYPEGELDDYSGPDMGQAKVIRGGSWANQAGMLRAAARSRSRPDLAHWHVGFRVARDAASR